MPATYEDSVFLNVPFDKKYSRLFDALVFAVHDCGFIAWLKALVLPETNDVP
jgi:hypothetical protein